MGGSAYAYAAGVNLDSSALKDTGVDCSTTWDGSEFQSPTVGTAKEWRKKSVILLLKIISILIINSVQQA